jgi:hypothetical protein
MGYYLINENSVIKLASLAPIKKDDFAGIINCDIYSVDEYLVVASESIIRGEKTFEDLYWNRPSDILELPDNDSAMLLFVLEYKEERKREVKLDEHISDF